MLAPRSETPRPRPPAKMRKQSSLLRLRTLSLTDNPKSAAAATARQVSVTSSESMSPITSSPPPAYGSAYDELLLPRGEREGRRTQELEVDEDLSATLLGSPISSTYKLMGYGRQQQSLRMGRLGGDEDNGWVNEKSKEELAGLLVKAEDIIKERANELGLTSSAVKNLYENGVALKTKHEALLACLPLASPPSPKGLVNNSSPDRILSRSTSRTDFQESPSPPPPPPLYRHTRRVSISTAEISQLADQNAELMSKLEQLESESTSADHAGRRELRRLEKEIAMLRQALEKTQAKSEELEEKTKGLDKGIDRVVEDAWKRKKEREQRMRALRNSRMLQEEDQEEYSPFRDFAPRGSTFGGPSKHFPLSRPSSLALDLGPEEDEEEENREWVAVKPKPELEIMSQLLEKVKELEQTNSRILQQQAETVSQLQAVQRDTEHISKVYECFTDPQEVELERAAENQFVNSIKLGSVRRRTESERVRSHGGKSRKPLVGLFGEGGGPDIDLPAVPFNSWWNDGRHRSSYSMGSGAFASPTLNFTSPHDDLLAELSPIGSRLTLEGELEVESTSWESEHQKTSWHLRSQSLSNISQLSMPSSPLASSMDNKTPVVADFPRTESGPLDFPRTPPQTILGTLPPLGFAQPNLNVEPPTPAKDRVLHQRPSFDGDQLATLQLTRSPRHEFISQRINARKGKWENERFGSLSSSTSAWGSPGVERKSGMQPVFIPPSQLSSASSSRLGTPAIKAPMPMRISTIVGTLVDQFDGNLSLGKEGTSPESDYEDAADYMSESNDGEEETGDEYGDDEDEEDETEGVDDEQTMVNRTPQFPEGNALQLHQPGSAKDWPSKTKEVRIKVDRNVAKNASGSTAKPSSKWGSMLLEVWLWLQFAVIIFVFLCAMAKRGPKGVLADTEQRSRTRKQSLRLRRK